MIITATTLVIGAGIALTSDDQSITVMLKPLGQPGCRHVVSDQMRNSKAIRWALSSGLITVEMDSTDSSDFVAQAELNELAILVSGMSGFSGASGFSGHGSSGSGIGISGFSGLSGFSGALGVSGFSGILGISGFSGQDGVVGFSGLSGFSGAPGVSGFSGVLGISGFSGQDGAVGFSGLSGFSGTPGVSGFSGVLGISGFSGQDGAVGFSGLSGFSGTPGVSGFSGVLTTDPYIPDLNRTKRILAIGDSMFGSMLASDVEAAVPNSKAMVLGFGGEYPSAGCVALASDIKYRGRAGNLLSDSRITQWNKDRAIISESSFSNGQFAYKWSGDNSLTGTSIWVDAYPPDDGITEGVTFSFLAEPSILVRGWYGAIYVNSTRLAWLNLPNMDIYPTFAPLRYRVYIPPGQYTSGDYIRFEFWHADGPSGDYSLYFSEVQLQLGSVALPYRETTGVADIPAAEDWHGSPDSVNRRMFDIVAFCYRNPGGYRDTSSIEYMYEALADTASTVAPRVLLMEPTPLRDVDNNIWKTGVDDASDVPNDLFGAVKRTAAKRNVFHKSVRDDFINSGIAPDILVRDSVHPSSAGNARIANLIADTCADKNDKVPSKINNGACVRMGGIETGLWTKYSYEASNYRFDILAQGISLHCVYVNPKLIGESVRETTTLGSSVTYKVSGRQIALLYLLSDPGGTASVIVDNLPAINVTLGPNAYNYMRTINLCGANGPIQYPDGEHTVTVTHTSGTVRLFGAIGLGGVQELKDNYSGFSGLSGFSGVYGLSGFSGISGFSGLEGISGFSSHSGFSGISGYSGNVSAAAYTYAAVSQSPNFSPNDLLGQITIGSTTPCKVFLHKEAGWNTNKFEYTLSALTNYQLTANTYSYIYADYNNGNPILSVTTDPSIINSSDKVLVAHAYWENQLSPAVSEIHYFILPISAYGKANKIVNRLINTFRYERSSGLSIGETGTRNITLSSGVIWYGDSSITLSPLDTSGINKIHFYYHVGGNWIVDNTVTQYNNTQYDNGTELQTLSNGHYAVNWVYRSVNHAEFFIVLGTNSHKLLDAQSSQPPALPTLISRQAILVGRIIVEKNAGTATQIDSAFATNFALSAVIPHNDLTGIQGGTANQYYHLTYPEYSALQITGFSGISGFSGFSGMSGFSGTLSDTSHNSLSSLQGGEGGDYYHSNQPINTTDFVNFSSLSLTSALSNRLLYTNNSKILANTGAGTTSQVLHGNESGVPAFASVVEDDISLSDVVTNNVSINKHGFVPKLSGSPTEFFNGEGNFISVSAITALPGYLSQTFSPVFSITINHNFGAYPCVQVLDGTENQIVPLNIQHNSINQFTVTFSESTSGRVIASVGSPSISNVSSVSSDYSILLTDNIITATAYNITLTLPNITALYTGVPFSVSGGEVTITQNGHGFVNGSIVVITNSNDITLLPNGTYVIYGVTINTFKVFIGSNSGNSTCDAAMSIAAGKEFTIDNDSSGSIFVTGYQTIQGETIQIVPTQSAMVVYNNGSKWRIR